MLEYGSFKFLFTGDIGSSVENSIASSKDVSCDVLKVAHHGSAGSSSSSFLSKTGAKYGVISVGADNSYGHPTSTALNNLSNAGISVYRTDQDGTAVFSTNGGTLTTPEGNSINNGSGSGSSGSGSGSSGSGSSSDGNADPSTSTYIGNSSTKVFHVQTCSRKPTTNAVGLEYTYSYIVNTLGYTPCSYCLDVSTTSYIGNSSTKVFHLSTCSRKPTKNAITLAYSYSYIVNTLGYKPCSYCLG